MKSREKTKEGEGAPTGGDGRASMGGVKSCDGRCQSDEDDQPDPHKDHGTSPQRRIVRGANPFQLRERPPVQVGEPEWQPEGEADHDDVENRIHDGGEVEGG